MKKSHCKSSFFLFLLLFVVISGCTQKKSYVVMLSLDGFRWDYTDSVPTPNLDYIAQNGVKAKSLKSSFPTKTFPNHYSLVTGLYPDHHGIVHNSFYDPVTDREYRIYDREAVEDGTFYGGEPLWVTAEKQQMISASYFWVGSEADIQGIRPTYWKKYDEGFPFSTSIDTVIHWLQLPEEKRPQLVLFYNSEPDHVGHSFGPDDDRVKEKVVYLDSLVGDFLQKLKDISIADQVDFLLVSDHGMTGLTKEKTVYLSDYISTEWFERIEGYNPIYLLQPKPEFKSEAYAALKRMKHAGCWKKDSLPEKWNYGSNDRIPDLVLVAENGWQIRKNRESKSLTGDHGYDNNFKDMHAIFYAIGPSFKENYVHPTFENVELYNLVCHILNLQPAENDGKFENVKGLLKE